MQYRKFVFCFIALLSGTALLSAQQFEQNAVHYEIINKRQVRVIADPTDSVYRQWTEVTIPETVRYEGKQYKVTAIGDQAFRYCHLLRQIVLPEGLRSVGYQSMMNCTQLEEIRLPQSVRKVDEMAFYGCASLRTAYVGKRIKKWSDMCFSDCTNLQTIYHANRRPPRPRPMTFFNCSDSITYCRRR